MNFLGGVELWFEFRFCTCKAVTLPFEPHLQSFFFLPVLGIKLRALYMLVQFSTTELHLQTLAF
jgi:hypothetical protein